jgi:regulator of G-protein signaling
MLNLKVHKLQKKKPNIFREFLMPGSPCEINIDGKTKEKTQEEMNKPSKSMFDYAAEHVYTFLLKKDSYPRFIRSEHYKNLLANGIETTSIKQK